MCEARCIFHIFSTKLTHQTKIEFLTPRSLNGQPKRCWSISFKSYIISLKSCMYFSPYYIWYIYTYINIKVFPLRLPWWLSGNKSICQCRRHRFNPWSRKTPHAMKQLRLCTTTTEPVLKSPGATNTEPTCCKYWSPSSLEPVLHNKRSRCSEKPKQQRRPSTAKNK